MTTGGEADLTGWIWDIKRSALHDGPGIRTAVFLKGCPLRCTWCCNPESQASGADILWTREKCLQCDQCLGTCPHGAIARDSEGVLRFDRDACDLCGVCSTGCPADAMNLVGRLMTVGDVLRQVMRDESFYARSGGGLTLSGGEPLAQPAFAAALLKRYKVHERGCHTALETSGAVGWVSFAGVVPWVDVFLFDLKHMDSAEHLRLTGVGNEEILENAQRLARTPAALVIRLPLVPGCNDDNDNIRRTAEFARLLPNVERLDILPYHRLGEPRYARLGRPYPLEGVAPLSAARLAEACAIVEGTGLTARVGG